MKSAGLLGWAVDRERTDRCKNQENLSGTKTQQAKQTKKNNNTYVKLKKMKNSGALVKLIETNIDQEKPWKPW